MKQRERDITNQDESVASRSMLVTSNLVNSCLSSRQDGLTEDRHFVNSLTAATPSSLAFRSFQITSII